MEISIKITEKSLRWAVALVFGTIIVLGLIGLLSNAFTPEGFQDLQNFGPHIKK